MRGQKSWITSAGWYTAAWAISRSATGRPQLALGGQAHSHKHRLNVSGLEASLVAKSAIAIPLTSQILSTHMRCLSNMFRRAASPVFTGSSIRPFAISMLLVLGATRMRAHPQSYTVLYRFNGLPVDGASPAAVPVGDALSRQRLWHHAKGRQPLPVLFSWLWNHLEAR